MPDAWALGFAIGGAVVVVVVLVVLTIIWLAAGIRDRAQRAVTELLRAEEATAPLWELQTTAAAADVTLAAARRLRAREEEGR